MMKYLQKLGKALMLPVAVLPICGILMGLGYALAPGVMGVPGAPTSGAAYTVGFLLVKAGGALIDNMAWLFAIGAAVGLADNDGTAGLAGLVSFLMMQQLLNPGVVGMVRTLEEGTATYIAFQKVAGNSFIGILAAIRSDCAAYRYSGWLTGFGYLSNALYSAARDAWQIIRDSLPETVVADLRADNAYWSQFRGTVSQLSDKVYDGFLKSNGDTDGAKSYGVVTDLLVAYFGA